MGPQTRYGFIGLGNIGLPMAQTIARAGLPLTVWARRPEATADFPDVVVRARTPRELAANSDVVGLCLFDAASVDDVMFGMDGLAGGLNAGSIVLIHSTVLPQYVIDLEAKLASVGVRVVDAPISGGSPAAALGELTIMLGGSTTDCDEVAPVIEAMSTNAVRLGAVGAGQKTKLLNNALLTAQMGLVNSMLDLADQLEIDRVGAMTALSTSSGTSFALEMFARGSSVATMAASQARPLLAKDVRLLASMVGEEALIVSVGEDFVKLMESSVENSNDEPTAVEGTS
ncbi:MAG: NAD(P)-dependent oxidoreductase [Actinomycetota bacterium]|nr:NAD(P)-dependent oxidoreductase [Actinomycetota bacterium]MDP2287291.1 NAD(P)-dependent oxidoreductase [Actinomycetota bacterium]